MNPFNLPARSLVLAILFLVLAGCGYHNPYLTQGGKPITIAPTMWSNRTTELGLENTLFQAQADWLRKSPLITIIDSPAETDYELTGTIDRVAYPEISFGNFQEGTEGRAELTVSFVLKKKGGKVVWERHSATRQETFYMSQDPLKLLSNRQAALKEIADDFGEEIYLHLITSIMRPN